MGLFDEVLDNVGKEYKGGKGFEYGTHEVLVGTVEAKTKDTTKSKGAQIIEVVVFDKADDSRRATCTLWFHTEGAAKMSVTKVLGMLVHSVGEDKKEKVRELGKQLFGSIDDPVKARDVAAKLMNDKLIGKEAYLVAEPNGKYSTTSYGDLWHYPAEPQTKPTVVAVVEDDKISPDDLPDFDVDKQVEDL
jgi:hypothetical protein